MYQTNETHLKLRIKDNNSLEIYHSYNPFPKKEKNNEKTEKEKVKIDYNYLSTKNYMRQLKSSYINLKDRKFDNANSIFITLTTEKIIDVYKLATRFNTFIKSFRKKYGKIEYARVIEFHELDFRCHIHAILQFEKKFYLSKKIIEKYWKIGRCYISNEPKDIDSTLNIVPYIDDVVNVIEYMTKFKPENISKISYTNHKGKEITIESDETFFPKGFRVFTRSPHFGQVVKVKSKSINITPEQTQKIINHLEKTHHIRKHCHYYKTEKGKKLFIDKVFIRNVTESKEELEKIIHS